MKVYTVRIIYKSGYTIDFDVKSFSIKNGTTFTWEWYAGPVPMMLGVENIAAIYQISERTVKDK